MEDAVRKTFFAKGDEVVNNNIAAIEDGGAMLVRIDIPDSWLEAKDEPKQARPAGEPAIVEKLLEPINRQQGDDLPVSAFKGYEDGTVELGLTAFEKRAIATSVPEWDPSRCIQCNRCSYVCPHAVIRPYLLTEEEKAAAPQGFLTMPAIGNKGLHFSMQVSRDDCTGCASWRLRLPREGKGHQDGPDREVEIAAGAVGLRPYDKRQGRGLRPVDRQGQSVPPAASRILGGLRRLRRDAIRKAHDAALRRPRLLGQRDRMLAGLGRRYARNPLHEEQGRKRPRVVELAL